MGIAWWDIGSAEIRNCKLLDEQLLGRRGSSLGWRTRAWRDAAHHPPCKNTRCVTPRPGTRHSRQYKAVRGLALFHSSNGLVFLVAFGESKICSSVANANPLCPASGRWSSADDGRIHGLLQLAAHRKSSSIALCIEREGIQHNGVVLVGSPQTSIGVPQRSVRGFLQPVGTRGISKHAGWRVESVGPKTES